MIRLLFFLALVAGVHALCPCQNGGTCIPGIGSYTCTCTSDFDGNNCDTKIIDVTAASDSSAYLFQGYSDNNPILGLLDGKKYFFRLGEAKASHPMQIKDKTGTVVGYYGYNTGVKLEFQASSAPYTYRCTIHSNMIGSIAAIDFCASGPCQNYEICANELMGDYSCRCANNYYGPSCASIKLNNSEKVDCSTLIVGAHLEKKDGRKFEKIDTATFHSLIEAGNFESLAEKCTSGISNMLGVFKNKTIFQHNIFDLDMNAVNATAAFADAEFPTGALYSICLPRLKDQQYQELENLNRVDIARRWVLKKAANRTCACLKSPCKNGAKCFDNPVGSVVEFRCVCPNRFEGSTCNISKSVSNENRQVTISFTNVRLEDSSYLQDDLKNLASDKLGVHTDQITVEVAFPITSRRAVDASVTFTIDATSLSDAAALQQEAIFKDATMNFAVSDSSSDMPLGLIIGLSVGGVALLSGMVYAFKKMRGGQAYTGLT